MPASMALNEELTDEEVLAHLARARAPASVREIAHALELRHQGRRALPKILARLKRKGEIKEVSGGRFALDTRVAHRGDGAQQPGGGSERKAAHGRCACRRRSTPYPTFRPRIPRA